MFLPFFETLRKSGLPVSLREFLTFLEAMSAGLATYDVEAFYYLARSAMVKDERHIDRFDRAFAASFKGLEEIGLQQVLDAVDIPGDWLKKLAEKHLSEAEKAEIEALDLDRRQPNRQRALWRDLAQPELHSGTLRQCATAVGHCQRWCVGQFKGKVGIAEASVDDMGMFGKECTPTPCAKGAKGHPHGTQVHHRCHIHIDKDGIKLRCLRP